MPAKTYTYEDLIKYAYVVTSYELAKYKYECETNAWLKHTLLKKELDRAHERVVAVREALGL
jgi:hypothetical protein